MELIKKNELDDKALGYIKLVIDYLIKSYKLSEDEAVEAVNSSILMELIISDREWTLHDPVESTADDVYREYMTSGFIVGDDVKN